jgi:hypothetical protein
MPCRFGVQLIEDGGGHKMAHRSGSIPNLGGQGDRRAMDTERDERRKHQGNEQRAAELKAKSRSGYGV